MNTKKNWCYEMNKRTKDSNQQENWMKNLCIPLIIYTNLDKSNDYNIFHKRTSFFVNFSHMPKKQQQKTK